MKVVFVVDSITELQNKINMLTNRFGDNILYVVRAPFLSLFKTYGYTPNAIYEKKLTDVIQSLVSKMELEDIVLCHASVKLDDQLLNKFIDKIGDKTKVVNVIPNYNAFEKMSNGIYNTYVKSIFKTKDSLASPKLQFLPAAFVHDLVLTHFGNKLFEIEPNLLINIYIEEKETSKSLKPKSKFSKFSLIPIIIALVITLGLLLSLAFTNLNFVLILLFITLYLLDILITIIFCCKARFDNRFIS